MDSFASAYLSVFLDELEEQLLTLDHAILELETDGNHSDTVQRIFRAAHTLKGSSAAMGFHQMKEVTHKVESVFDLLRQEQLILSSGMINILFNCIDYLKLQRETLKQGQMEEHPNETLLHALEQILNGRHACDTSLDIVRESTPGEQEPAAVAVEGWNPSEMEEMTRKRQEGIPLYMVSVTLSSDADMPTVRGMLVHRTLSETGEIIALKPALSEWDNEELLLSGPISFVVASTYAPDAIEGNVLQLSQISDVSVRVVEPVTEPKDESDAELESGIEAVPAAILPSAVSKSDTPTDSKVQIQQTVRVDVKRLEHLLNLVGELIIDNTRLKEVRKRLDERYKQETEVAMLGEVTDHLNRVIAELQEGMMKTRMLPIEQLFNRFPRLVRDLSQQAGKEIHFTIEGKETELDRTLIEEISDPLIHILRNAADHGLESPEERERLGKPRKGHLHLQASHQENAIVIRVKDDGRGIDPEKIKQKAIHKGFISQDEASRLTDKEMIALIFHSGMSTAEQVTELSGRGVGMDIVRTHIEKLNGLIDIDTAIGKGTEITIKLPLTLAITRSLLVELGKHTFAVPLVHVLETFQLSSADIQSVHGKEICTVRGELFPLIRLHDKLRTIPISSSKGYAVMIGAAEKRVCLYVDKLVANQEIVMKPLSSYLGQVPYVSGSSILGNGSISYILDVNAVVRDAGTVTNHKRESAQQKAQVRADKRVAFMLGEQQYALDIEQVKEIIRVPTLSQVAADAPEMLGVFNLRGSLLPVVDLSQCLGLAPTQLTEDSRVIVMSTGGNNIGVLVDSVTEVFNMPDNEVETTPAAIASIASEYIRGIHKKGDELTVLLHADRLLAASGYRA
ncbi:chemotaxis protein CheA [Cohnella cholangitidis]|uniref:Chemotaxis protein CheA n=1 Tax=Cohnella cholangitidis TaxID=2598458 RepID=A0A7G5BWS9_9BACL|nr:chemotaxis protein CheA [Cohnella cholangitidis]QMV41413.1 chemotaxis protein CheA [Cohnella cholangitidis]